MATEVPPDWREIETELRVVPVTVQVKAHCVDPFTVAVVFPAGLPALTPLTQPAPCELPVQEVPAPTAPTEIAEVLASQAVTSLPFASGVPSHCSGEVPEA